MIEASGLSRTFEGLLAVDDVTLSIPEGEAFAFLGPNGAGKTTTVRMLCCLISPTSGTARIGGLDINERKEWVRIRGMIGLLPENPGLYESLGATPQTQPYDLGLQITSQFADQTFNNSTIMNTRLIGCNLNGCVVLKCELSNCTVANSLVRDSEFNYSSSIASAIWHSNIRHSTVDAVSDTSGSIFIGQESQEVFYTKLLVNSLLMFFVLIPSIIPTVIASYSFVGEKLNKSLEPLLATPTTDKELLAGKTLAIFLPSMLVTWISLVPTIVLVDVITFPVLGYYLLPDPIWLVGVFLVAPLVCILSVLFNVIVSARVTDVRTSQQIGSIVILPVIAFFIVGLAGLVTFSLLNMLLFGIALVAIDIGVIYLALSTFQREKILVRWK